MIPFCRNHGVMVVGCCDELEEVYENILPTPMGQVNNMPFLKLMQSFFLHWPGPS